MKAYFLIFGFLLMVMGCKDNTVNPISNSSFSIYLLKDKSLTTNDISNININSLELDSNPWLALTDIDFYDYSSHCIYLNRENNDSLMQQVNIGLKAKPFIVFANNKRCYIGSFLSLLSSSSSGAGPQINELDYEYRSKDILHISNVSINNVDLRNDLNVVLDLTACNKLHKGLSLSLKDVNIVSNTDTATVKYTFTITNNDKDNLYVIDPDKMNSSLFHYFTNGVDFHSGNKYISSEYKKIEHPETFNSWKAEWFTKIESGSTIERTVTLEGYPHIPEGTYECSFVFSNPLKIDKNKRIKSDGRLWLGNIYAEANITIGK